MAAGLKDLATMAPAPAVAPQVGLSFKAGTAPAKKRSTIAEGIAKKNPGIPMGSKFAIATAQTKKVFRKKGKNG